MKQQPEQELSIRTLDASGRGIGHLANPDGTQGKVVFVDGALPGEKVMFRTVKRKPSWEAGTATRVLKASSLRVEPRCAFYGVCGGCAMQHLEPGAQVAAKQRVLEDNLWHIGRVHPERMLPAIYGPSWHYRFRARISVRFVKKKGEVLVGFHERHSSFVSDMTSCEVLPKRVSDLLVPLRGLVGALSIVEHLPQIELAVGQGAESERDQWEQSADHLQIVMVLRIMRALTPDDEVLLKSFADQHRIVWWLQTAGPDSAQLYYPTQSELYYTLPEFGIKMPFKPTDFTQVNHQINRVLVARAIRLLDPQPGERVADLFCGLGNFTLPLATQAAHVVGIEGSRALVERAMQNAVANGVADKTEFHESNLFEMTPHALRELGYFDRMLIDPPRDGAQALCESMDALWQVEPQQLPKRLVYVSCGPATLARDAAILTKSAYRLSLAGVVNMFPHTAHVESMAVFDRIDVPDGA